MAVMDYSQHQRVIDGTGRILDTTMTNPNTGSWVSEQQLKTWINTGMATDADLAAEVAQREAADTDLKNALTAVDHRVQNLEQAKGDYVAVDSTKGVISVPSGKGKWAVVEKLRGVTRAKNQLGTLFTTEETWTSSVPEQLFSFLPHKYLCFFQYKFNTLNQSFRFRFNASEWTINDTISASDLNWHTYAKIADETHTLTSRIQFRDPTFDSSSIQLYQFNVVDLTLCFGAGNEPTLAEIQAYYPWLLSPSDYGTSIVDTTYSAVKSRGFNIFDKGTIKQGGYISDMGGGFLPDARCSATDYIEIIPNETYYIKTDATSGCWGAWYDADKNFISGIKYATQKLHVAPSNARYVALTVIYLYSGNVDTFCLNVSQPNTSISPHDGDYLPYMTDTLSLPTPITLRSAGTVAEEYFPETGRVTHPIGEHIITGNENMNYGTWADNTISLILPSAKPIARGNSKCLTSIYDNVTAVVSGGLTYVRFVGATSRWASLDAFKADAIGKLLRYALATPDAPTQLDPIQNPTILTEAGGTISAQTEEPIDGNFSVGFITL